MSRKLILNFNDERSLWAIPPALVQRVRAALPAGWELINVKAPVSSRGDGAGISAEALAAVRDAEIYAGPGFPLELFKAAGDKLKWVHSSTTGVGATLYPEMIASDIVLTNSAGIHAPPIAETVIAGMLHFTRGIDFATRAQARSNWDQSEYEKAASPVTEVEGLTLGILGYGGIGREVARRAHALGMRVIATRRSRALRTEHAEVFTHEDGFERVLRESDVLVIALPSTKRTRALIGARELALMKRSAIVVNVARGNIIVEAALIDALQKKLIRGAALDVFEIEPLPAESPLWSLPNVLVLPHMSGSTSRFWERQGALILENLERYLKGQRLRNVVHKTEGY